MHKAAILPHRWNRQTPMKQPDTSRWQLLILNLRSGLYTTPGYRGGGTGPLAITDQITDQKTPYCDELEYGISNDVSMLAVIQRKVKELNLRVGAPYKGLP